MNQLSNITVAERQGNMILLDSSLEWERISYSDSDFEARRNRALIYINEGGWFIHMDGHLFEKGNFPSYGMSADQRKRIAQLRFTSFLNSLI